ncbi:DUF2407 C-terminal domain-containing protein [Xylaria bambusicola]|uniref:DUF2407 C-terminal domain-containing protein n=1 Tax=Xylaria bambusicola TaxID=326684 RepID=UPI002008036E|nr:DUF2407 C-terminal domain-containing protein [Xylaria bambusicola]KAI0508258.1 DUF2407 C-terminal domain-containing protein [Xylaria bambusicola]
MTTTTASRSPLLPKAMSGAPPPLLLTIRFSAALPDLELDIPRPGATTVVSLKDLIRSRLDKAHARRRLRFIHGGKILPDTAVLSSVLRALPPPPPSSQRSENGPSTTNPERQGDAGSAVAQGGKSKGKSVPGRPEPAPRIYVNCSIGDELSPSELESEAKAAALPPPTSSSLNASSATPGLNLTIGTGAPATTTTSAPPRGFDRLLSTGFTASEVNQLRLQFRSIHSSRYTPDTLPSPDSFRRMEDAWIDDNGAAMPTAATGVGANGGGGGMLGMGGASTASDELGLVALVDLLVRGVIIGFIWPLGSAGWLIREEGMSSDRWRFMVGIGIMFGVLIGFIRAISGDDK